MITEKRLIAIGRSRYLFNAIQYLVSVGYEIKAIVTDEAYEEYDIKSHDFEELAKQISATFFQTKELLVDDFASLVKENQIKVAISANWRFTIAKDFLSLFECGILNFHLGNLPDYKGNATVNWSIINGESVINANIHKMEPELDAGDIVIRKAIPVTEQTYISEIIKEAEMLAPLLYEEALEKVTRDPHAFEVLGTRQGFRCYPRLPEDSQINWHDTPEAISRLIRASARPYQGAFTFLNGEKVIIWKARPCRTSNVFFAIPGHILSVDKNAGSVLVACKDGIMEIQEIESDRMKGSPAAMIKSIKLRFKYLADV